MFTWCEKKKIANKTRYRRHWHSNRIQKDVVATALAMIYLNRGLRPPAIAVWDWKGGDLRLHSVRAAIRELDKKYPVPMNHAVIDPSLPLAAVDRAPVLYISGTDAFELEDDDSIPSLVEYLATGGLLVIRPSIKISSTPASIKLPPLASAAAINN